MQNKNRNIPGFSTLPPQDLSPHLRGTGLRWSLVLPVLMFTLPPSQFAPLGTYNKAASDLAPAHAYTVQPAVLDVDPTTSL
jgi:hypothetical protein